MLNAFRLAGDLFHVISIFVLLLRLRVTQNAIGISMKTQEIYLVVFVTRYLDLFTTYYSLYNSIMKILYIASTSYIIYMVRRTEPFKTHYEVSHDSFLHWKFAVAPCAVVAIITHFVSGEFNLVEVREGGNACINLRFMKLEAEYSSLAIPLYPSPHQYLCKKSKISPYPSLWPRTSYLSQLLWVFSIYLESLAIIPQLIMLQRYREVENLTGHYVFFLGAYRFLYILNWIYR